MNSFFKYQSLGNDFIVFDWYSESFDKIQALLGESAWSLKVAAWCDRHTGVGADGVLVLLSKQKIPLMRIFNADGSEAENCMNGLRCIAQRLVTQHNFSGSFQVCVGSKLVTCGVVDGLLSSEASFVLYEKPHTLIFSGGTLSGYCVDAGNPHFIVFQPTTQSWLQQYGKELESHADFPKRANISFVWPHRDGYNMLTFERGCGITQACSSAALAILKTMASLGMIIPNDMVTLCPLGGVIKGVVTPSGSVVIYAQAQMVFQGDFTAS